jgi:hypothetical protein
VLAPNRELSLLRTLEWYGILDGNADEKELVRHLIISRAWEKGSPEVWQRILHYCADDVRLTAQLFAKMEPQIPLQAALIRGRYVAEQGRMFQRGIPVDGAVLQQLRQQYREVLRQYRGWVDPDGRRLTPKGRVRKVWLAAKVAELQAEAFHPQTPKGAWSAKVRALQGTAEQYEDRELRDIAQWVEMLALFPEGKDGTLRISPMGCDQRVAITNFHLIPIRGALWDRGKRR